MKKFTKLLGIVLIIALVMSMGIMAFAEDTTGTITIKSSEKNTEYDFYRILDLTGQDTTTPTPDGKYDVVSYTIATKWAAFFTAAADPANNPAGVSYLIPAATATAEQKSSLNAINFNGSVYYLNLTNDNVVAFTNAAMEYAMNTPVANDGTATGTGSDVAKADLPLGYYLMIPVDASIKTANSSGSVASITSTIPNADILVKAEKPKIEKKDDKVSADVGQTVTYTVTGTVPNTAGYATYKYVISDTMTSGLTFNKNVTAKIVTDATTDPVKTVDVPTDSISIDYDTANAFTADIEVMELQDYVGKTITLTYTATVNEAAIVSTYEKNTVQLKYGHDSNDLEEGTPISEEVYTAKIDIIKYTGDDATSGTKLPDASFALMNSEGKYYKYTAATGTAGQDGYVPAKVEWVEVTGAPTDGTASVTDAQASALAAATNITTKTTNANGSAEFPGIADGTYYLVEFAAPAGYNRLDKPQAVTVAGTDADASNANKTENVADATGEFDTANDATAEVLNNSGTVLPSTGGIGTTIFYVVGSILVVAAGVLLITKKRMSREG
jgi:fimbrial isopeptide formation D2 family protein/LPXTG-motif cell wall-anchored protein